MKISYCQFIIINNDIFSNLSISSLSFVYAKANQMQINITHPKLKFNMCKIKK